MSPLIVFIHGVPETEHLWERVRGHVTRESLALSLPGFGTARPAGFGATKDDYVRWILARLDGIGEPIDLVGTDWGALFTYRIATAHGHRIRSWVADAASNLHPDYSWHAYAQVLQSPDSAEAFVAQQRALSLDDAVDQYKQWGLPAEDAVAMHARIDVTMWGCMTDLYRSATPNLHQAWGPLAPTSAPGLVLHPEDEPGNDPVLASEVAAALGAAFRPLEGTGHFWPYQAPEKVAAVMESFWSGISTAPAPADAH